MTSEARGVALLALAARCEGAAGADRELDIAILTHPSIGYRDVHGDGMMFDRGNDGYWYTDDCEIRQLPSPTGSLDAALSLIPDTEYDLTNLYGVARAHVEMSNEYGGHHGSNACNSMPLAVCAAMLRALAYQEETNP